MSLWTNDVSQLWTGDSIRQLFPTKTMTYNERVNALVRLIILGTACVYLYSRDTRHVLFGIFTAGLLTAAAALGTPKTPRLGAPPAVSSCQRPTPDNPFMNVLLGDYKYNPDRPPACKYDDVAPEIEAAYAKTVPREVGALGPPPGFNNFYTVPDTSTWQAGREEFARALYGNNKTCKSDQGLCR